VIFRPLVKSVGFGWTLRIFAFICLAFLGVAIAVLKQRATPNKPRKLLDSTAFREADYVLFLIGMFLFFVGGYIPYYYMPAFAQLKIHTSPDLAFNMLPIIAGGSTLGRVIPNLATQKFGIFNVAGFCILVCGMLLFIWGAVHNIGGMAIYSLFYGFFSGILAAIPAVAIAQLSPHVGLIGTRMGMAFQVAAVGFLIGNPIAGAILNGRSSFDGLQAFGGACLLGAFVFICLTSQEHAKRQSHT
jgi:predicted MFS family arabinose efflux permease